MTPSRTSSTSSGPAVPGPRSPSASARAAAPRPSTALSAAARRGAEEADQGEEEGRPPIAGAQAHGLPSRSRRRRAASATSSKPAPRTAGGSFVLQRDRRGRRNRDAADATASTWPRLRASSSRRHDAVVLEMDGKANKEGAPSSASRRRPQFAPGRPLRFGAAVRLVGPGLLDEPGGHPRPQGPRRSRAQHGPPVKGPRAPAITGRVRVVATTDAASPGVAALHNGRTGVVTKRAAGWIEVQLDATSRRRRSRAASATSSRSTRPGERWRRPRARLFRSSASRRRAGPSARALAGMIDRRRWKKRRRRRASCSASAKKKDGGPPLATAEKAAVLHAIAQLDGKATQKKVRRAAPSALGAPEGALAEGVKEVREDEMRQGAQVRACPPRRPRRAQGPQGREQEAKAREERGRGARLAWRPRATSRIETAGAPARLGPRWRDFQVSLRLPPLRIVRERERAA